MFRLRRFVGRDVLQVIIERSARLSLRGGARVRGPRGRCDNVKNGVRREIHTSPGAQGIGLGVLSKRWATVPTK